MKKKTLILILALVALTAGAQDKLMRIDAEARAIRMDDAELSFHDKEIARLLIPQNALFGMITTPSNGFESAMEQRNWKPSGVMPSTLLRTSQIIRSMASPTNSS